MSDRLAEISARIDGVRKLGSVMGAMRGMAAARVRQAEAELRAVDSYEATISGALSRVLAMVEGGEDDGGEADTLVVFLAEQGFAGAFSERLLDDVPQGPRLFLLGTRGAALARERGVRPWMERAMPGHLPAVPRFADTLARDLLGGGSRRIDAMFTRVVAGGGLRIETRRLFPVRAAPASDVRQMPLMNLPPQRLLSDLLVEALHAGLTRAALHALAAENLARMQAMAAAQSQTERKLGELVALERQLRQEAITSEIIELAAGEAAFRKRRREIRNG